MTINLIQLIIMEKIISDKIVEISANTKFNDLHKSTPEPAWGTPIIGFANGDDKIFDEIKTEIGDFHWKPIDAWKNAFPDKELQNKTNNLSCLDKDITVVSVIFPQTIATLKTQENEEIFPAENWVRSRYYWEDFAESVAKEFTEEMNKQGITTITPVLLKNFSRVSSEKHNYSSKWSERHIAYACGLGTFGYSEGLITPVGKAVRILSFIINAQLKPTKRPYSKWNEYCLFYKNGTCKKCIDRCPAGSLTNNGHDKNICEEYAYGYTPETEKKYGMPNNSCGLCQVKVPCEKKIP